MTVTAMTRALRRIAEIAKKDGRYHFDSYIFIQQSLAYAQFELGMGVPRPFGLEGDEDEMGTVPPEAHLTGQQLCEAIRLYALDMYGLMAKVVLKNWGIRKTADFGNIVYNLIEIGEMTQSEEDRLEDFTNVYDFEQAFERDYVITRLEAEDV